MNTRWASLKFVKGILCEGTGQRQSVSSAVSFHLQSAHTICHGWVYTARKSRNGRLLLFVFLFLMFLHFNCVTLCVAMGKTRVLLFVSMSVCVFWSGPLPLCWGRVRQAAGRNWREWLWPSDKIKSKVFSVSIVFSALLHFLSSQPHFPSATPSLLYLFPQNCRTELQSMVLLFISPSFLLGASKRPSTENTVHIVQSVVWIDFNSALFLAW